MSSEFISSLMGEALYIATLMVVVIILPSLLVGLVVSVFQAATQINEQTLSFLPRLLVTMACLMIAGPWLGKLVYEFTQKIILDIPYIIG